MTNTLKVMLQICALALACAVAAACGGAAPADRGRPLVGVSLLTRTQTFYKELEDALRAEADAQGLDLAIVACEMDPARQVAQFEDFVTQRVDAILAAPCDSTAIVPSIEAAAAAGIPVFTADIAARGGPVVSHVASDNLEGGRLAARTLAEALGGAGDIVIIDHPEVASVQDRVQGFEDVMAGYPGIRIVQRPSASGQRARAMAVMEDMLQAHGSLAGVFAINDDTALGALSVLEAAGRTDIVIVGFDATDEAQQAIARGSALVADIQQHPAEIGRTAIQVIARHLAGEPVEPVVAVPVSVVDRDAARQAGHGPAD
ncbi:MAG: substrate-binding domain-containing protein [Acidobacteriota bacterium]|jgi:ribose transport system substrate-binding protein|nr:MAG: D-ribose ABC transporter substrate-binding protein [Acidobacteriota bacterium]